MTTLIYDNHNEKSYLGVDLFDAITQIALISVNPASNGGWVISARIRGYSAPVTPMAYSSGFTREEALRDAMNTLQFRITRDCSRYDFFKPY